MPEIQREELSAEMRGHERRIAELIQTLASIQRQQVPRAHHEVVFLTAQMMKHRISIALLASRLGVAMPLPH